MEFYLNVLAGCLNIVRLALPGHGTDAARALSFASLVVAFITSILVNRSWTQSLVHSLRVTNPSD